MNTIMKMFYKKDDCFVNVYDISIINNHLVATIFSPNLYGKTGNGWDKVKLSSLIPEEYYDPLTVKGFMSKTEKNKIKSRLTLTSAVWTCTDGVNFTDCDEAIIHEKEIMNMDKN